MTGAIVRGYVYVNNIRHYFLDINRVREAGKLVSTITIVEMADEAPDEVLDGWSAYVTTQFDLFPALLYHSFGAQSE